MSTVSSMKNRGLGFGWALAGASLVVMLLLPATALAQEGGEGGAPPLPIVYQGEVYVDGQLLTEAAELTARIGDWESRPATVQDGAFDALVVGPPSVAYVGRDITFHLGELVASQQFTFSLLTQPSFEPLRLDFTRPAEQQTPAPSPEEAAVEPTATPVEVPLADDGLAVPWAVLGGLLAGGAVLVVVLNRIARRWLRDGR